ncbi:hypothetical protein [Chitinophaga sp. CB10]|uniref:hypothetical protein n=1 Tax=Chitinophaga sp. CB10 TaxID=1891659 RepID=UPI0025C5B7AC|nr:hypothetical protein [Chitinophaga sp. CB10]
MSLYQYSKSFYVGINILLAASPSLYRFKLQRLLSVCDGLQVAALPANEWLSPETIHREYDLVLIESNAVFRRIESQPWNAPSAWLRLSVAVRKSYPLSCWAMAEMNRKRYTDCKTAATISWIAR